MAAVHGLAAAFWLASAVLGLFGDCRPRDIDGQCGMALFFAGAIGLAGAFVLVAGGTLLLGLGGDLPSRDRRRLWRAATAAVLAGITAVHVGVLGALLVGSSQPLPEVLVSGLRLWPLTAFLSAPYAYAIVFVVALACDLRARRSGRVRAWWAAGVGAVSGMSLGLVVGLHWGYTVVGRAEMVAGGGGVGALAAWVFWRVGLRGRRHAVAAADDVDALDAV